jgi:argininosuccinate synthase
MKRIVLAYSGGLDTSVAVRWVAERYDAEIIAVTLDLGQGEELTNVRERALAVGAVRAHVIDAREEFARDFVLPALQARAIYEDGYPLASALARPLIAKHLVAIARMERATAVAHGCTAKDNDQVGLDISVRALDGSLDLIAPAREWEMSRSDEIEYARLHNIPVPVTIASPYSIDSNLWGRSIECGILEDAWTEPPEDIYTLTRSPQQCPDEPAHIEIEFDRGVPVRVNGIDMAPVELIESLETIAGAHGVGRIDMIENRLVGIKSREIYETPAAALLLAAYGGVEELVCERDLAHTKQQLALQYATLIYNGLWYSPLRLALQAFMDQISRAVTGTAKVKLYRGSCAVVGRIAEGSLYDHGLATYEEGDSFQHGAAAGFIHVWSLPTKTWAAAMQPDTVEV